MRSTVMLICLSCLAYYQLANAAPIPASRPTSTRRPPALGCGVYDLYWNGSPWRTTLATSGAYESRLGGTIYRGWWSYCPRRHEVTITERVCGADNARWETWTQKLDRKWAGPAVYELTSSRVKARWRRIDP